MKYWVLIFPIFSQLWAAELGLSEKRALLATVGNEAKDERHALINHRPCWVINRMQAKEHSKKIYPDGGPWDDPNAPTCKKCYVAFRRTGCYCEHVTCPLSTALSGLISWGLALSCGVPEVAAGVGVSLPVSLLCFTTIAVCSGCLTSECDKHMSDPNNWPQQASLPAAEQDPYTATREEA